MNKIIRDSSIEGLTLVNEFLIQYEQEKFYRAISEEVNWKQLPIKLFGKSYLQPRLIAWQGEFAYTYSGTVLKPCPFSERVGELKERVENQIGQRFNSVLINWYRDGNDGMGFHNDLEKELGEMPLIASLSLGVERYIHFKPIQENLGTERLLLTGGSLLIMEGKVQNKWKHGIPKTKRKIGGRINLTFRNILFNLKTKSV